MSNVQGENPTLTEVLESFWTRKTRGMQTAFPGTVTKDWDPATLTVEVEPQFHEVWRANEERISQAVPPIPNVPLVFPRAGNFGLTFPVVAGDTVLVICTKYSLDRWREQAQATDPGDPRKFTLAGAVAIPGLYHNEGAAGITPAPASADLVISSPSLVHVGDPGSTDWLTLYTQVKKNLDDLKTAFDSHTHLYNACSGGDVGVVAPAQSAASTNHGYTVTDPKTSKIKAQ